MSLDVYLIQPGTLNRDSSGTGIFVRDKGQIKEITREEWDEKFPGQEPLVVKYEDDDNIAYHANITHNLNKMADEAGIYEALWRPYKLKTDRVFDTYDKELAFEESCRIQAKEIIPILEEGIERLKSDPRYFKRFNAENGWGTYEQFLPWVSKYLKACTEYPDAVIEVSR